MATTAPEAPLAKAPELIALAVPFLGIMAAIQVSSANINSTALVSLTRELGMQGDQVALAASIQTIAIAASVITTGFLADRLGRRKVLLVALLVGAAGAALSGLAPVFTLYLLGQTITGVGLGAVYGASFAYIHAVARPGKLAAALGVFSAMIGLSTLIFTFLGGLLVGIDWRFAFFVLTIASVVSFFLVPLVLPDQPKLKSGNLDIGGQILLALGIIAFLYGISQLGKSLMAPSTLIPLIAGVLVLAVFFLFESKNKIAFYPVRLFLSPVFIAAMLIGFVHNYGLAVSFLQMTNLWQYVTDVPTEEIAFWQVPLVAAGIVGALIMGRLMSKGMSNRTAGLIGTLFAVTGFILLAMASDQKSFIAFVPGTVIAGAGVVMVTIPFNNLIIRESPPAQFGPVTSSRTTIGKFFYSMGFAVSTILVDRLTIGGVTQKLTDAGVQPDSIGTVVTSMNLYVKSEDDPTTKLGKEALADSVTSYSSAFTSVMLLSAALMFGAGLVAFWLLRNYKEPAKETAGSVESKIETIE